MQDIFAIRPIHARAISIRGFTLVELMVTIAVLAIILGIAAPSFTEIIHRNRLVAGANELVAAMQTAKMEAIRRNARVGLCPTVTGAACSGGDWSRLVVYEDANSNSSLDAGETVVREVQAVRSGAGISASSTVDRIRFGADGRARFGTAGATSGDISLVSSKLPSNGGTRRVQVSASRVSVCNPSGVPSCS